MFKIVVQRGRITFLAILELIQVVCYRYSQKGVMNIIIHQTHCEKSDWSIAFNQFTIGVRNKMAERFASIISLQ